jgi:beta-1,4-mannosyl-glycoprotein beta-1,4-N-acetylglucosaminyltransferase
MSLNEYLAKNGLEYLNEGHMYSDQCEMIEKQIDWSKVRTILEIGFNAGHSSVFFLGHPGVSVVSFEMTPGTHTLLGKKYIDENFPGRHEMVWGDSTLTLPKFETRKFDLIFIDGGHHLEVARQDLTNCMRFAREDTIVIMDDVIYDHARMKDYSLGPTRSWREFINNSIIEETFHRDISDGRGMSIGRYKVFHDISVPRPKVVDAFMFYNELEMLKYRLTVMGPYVDRFVICECPVSFAGKPKPLYFQENKQLFEPWLDKITHLVWHGYRGTVETLDDSWYNENNQRNHLLEGLKDLDPRDIVIISDLDEIVSPSILEQVDNVLAKNPIVSLYMDLYYYDIEHMLPDPWGMARIARYKFVRDTKPHFCRNSTRNDPIIKDAGWHLTFFGNDEFIVNKTKNYAHLEAADFFSSVSVPQVKKAGIAVSSASERQLVFVPKAQNARLPPLSDSLPHCIFSLKTDHDEKRADDRFSTAM